MVDPGSILTLICVVTNVTNSTQVVWTGPEGSLSETSMSFNGAMNEKMSTLMIDNVSYTNGGTYLCSVMPNDTTYSDSVFIVIRPTISPAELMARADSTSSNFTCNVQSSLASVVWYMYDLSGGGGEIVTTGSGSGMMAYVDTVLDFMTVMFADAGLYQCAVNATAQGLGEVTRSGNATLTGEHVCPVPSV